MRLIILLSSVAFLTGCTAVKYNGGQTFIKRVDHPEIGVITTAYVGDYMVQKGTLYEENVLVVHKPVDGVYYDIPAKEYKQIGYDGYDEFYSASGVSQGGFSGNTASALAVKKNQNSKIRVVNINGVDYPYSVYFSREKRPLEHKDSFQQTLIYSGHIGDKINISYRELSNDYARPAFNNDVEYDLSASNIIGDKGGSVITQCNGDEGGKDAILVG